LNLRLQISFKIWKTKVLAVNFIIAKQTSKKSSGGIPDAATAFF
jgi:hypothetical protein